MRRAKAAGALARGEVTLPLTTHTDNDADTERRDHAQPDEQPPRPARKPGRQLVLYAHLATDAVTGTTSAGGTAAGDGCGLVRVENTRSFLLVDQVKSWCADPHTQVTVKPVIDLTTSPSTTAYETPDRLRELVVLRDSTCVWPWCTRHARRCDLDHRIPHHRGGPTCGCNLAPLCRKHHRAKTHTPWRYERLGAGVYLWTSPRGQRFLRDTIGTRPLTDTHCPHTGRPDDNADGPGGSAADPPET